MQPFYQDDMGCLYCGDCLNILPSLDLTKKDTAVITDPPYGISWKGHRGQSHKWGEMANDDGALDLTSILSMPCLVISFGADCYPHQLPHAGRWLCWDKRVDPRADKAYGSSFELAWTNRTEGTNKIYRVMHGGYINADGGKRVHPTQKPVILLKQIILDYTEPGDLIVDPFSGSGTTLIAAKQLNRKYLGIEISEDFCSTIRRRLQTTEEFLL